MVYDAAYGLCDGCAGKIAPLWRWNDRDPRRDVDIFKKLALMVQRLNKYFNDNLN